MKKKKGSCPLCINPARKKINRKRKVRKVDGDDKADGTFSRYVCVCVYVTKKIAFAMFNNNNTEPQTAKKDKVCDVFGIYIHI